MTAMSPQTVHAVIVITNAYRRWRYAKMLQMTAVTAGCLVFVLFLLTIAWSKPDNVSTFQIDTLGRITQSIPLDRPNVDDEKLKAWATDAVTRINTFDFANYKAQMQDNRRFLTEGGRQSFEDALNASGNFESILRNNYVVTAVPAGPAVILWKGSIPLPTGGSRFGWTVEIPIVVTYRSNRQEIAQRMSVTAAIGRMPEQGTSGMGLGIRQVIAK